MFEFPCQADLLFQGACPQHRPLDKGPLPHEKSQIDLGFGAGGHTNNDLPTTGGQDLQVPFQIRATHQIENQVHTPPTTGFHDSMGPILVTQDPHNQPKPQGPIHLVLGTGGSDSPDPGGLGQLDCSGANTAPHGMNEDRLPFGEAHLPEDGIKGRHEDFRNRPGHPRFHSRRDPNDTI